MQGRRVRASSGGRVSAEGEARVSGFEVSCLGSKRRAGGRSKRQERIWASRRFVGPVSPLHLLARRLAVGIPPATVAGAHDLDRHPGEGEGS